MTGAALLGAASIASFVFGLTSSLHCAAMCGPIAACAVPAHARGKAAASLAVGYHTARVAAYAMTGALAGALGASALGIVPVDGLPYVSIAAGVLLLLQAVGVLRRARNKLLVKTRASRLAPLARRAAELPPALRAAALGAMTPLLPCGILVGVYAVALSSGSALAGAASSFAFSLGALPALAAAQASTRLLKPSAGGVLRLFAERGFVAFAAAVLIYRGVTSLGGASCCG